MIKPYLNTGFHRVVVPSIFCSHNRTISASKCSIHTTSANPRLSKRQYAGSQSSAVYPHSQKDDLGLARANQTIKSEDEYLQRVFESTVKSSRGVVSVTEQTPLANSIPLEHGNSLSSQISSTASSQHVLDRPRVKRKRSAPTSAQHSPLATRVKNALDSSNTQWMLLLWQEALLNGDREEVSRPRQQSRGDDSQKQNIPRTVSGDRNPRGSRIISYALCNQFLTAFMALKDPRHAIEVWNYMVSSGETPSQASWNAMLDGCRIARDIKSLYDVWGKMQASGVHPDNGCWTTKISAFAQAGRFSQSVATLREMGTTWLMARSAKRKTTKPTSRKLPKSKILPESISDSETDDNGIVKPSIEALNATLSYVPKHIDERQIDALLSWGKVFELEANIITYNSLMRAHVNADRTERALQVLEEMDINGVPPDVITYTIVLAGLLRNSETMSSENSTKIIGRVLDEMEGNGIEANAFSYGTIVHGLLKHHSNVSAARAILDHMDSKGLKASPQIFTILATYYFETRPVNLVALDELWDQIRIQGVAVDHIFYDIMIKGYAEIGDVSRMAAMLRAASLQRKDPGWDVLAAALRACLAAGETSRAEQLVREIEKGDQIFRRKRRMSKSQAEFEAIVEGMRQKRSEISGL